MAGIDASTVLLLQMNGDRSSSQHSTIFSNATEIDAAVKKFGYGSSKFNGTSSYINLPYHTDWNILSLTEFTIEAWCWFDSNIAGLDMLFGRREYMAGTNGGYMLYNNAGDVSFYTTDGASWDDSITVSSVPQNQWVHIAVVKTGTGTDESTLYVNGVGTAGTISNTNNNTEPLYIGVGGGYYGISGAPAYFGGNIDEFRISDVARWTSDFDTALPTEQYESDGNTLYLNHFEGDISDGNHNIEISGSPVANALDSKWHGSMYFGSTGTSYMTVPDSSDFDFSASNFTIDWWCKLQRPTESFYTHAIIQATSLINGYYDTGNVIFYVYGGGEAQAATMDWTYPYDAWHHTAIVKNGTEYKAYLNGILQSTDTMAAATDPFTNIHIGIARTENPNNGIRNGYMDEFRISNVARWLTDFDVPLNPFSRFDYKISGDIGLDGNVALYNPTTLELNKYEAVTAPSYSIIVNDNSEVNVVAIPTDDSNNIKAFRDVTPEIM